jgi:hypothetical protein
VDDYIVAEELLPRLLLIFPQPYSFSKVVRFDERNFPEDKLATDLVLDHRRIRALIRPAGGSIPSLAAPVNCDQLGSIPAGVERTCKTIVARIVG